MTKMLLTAFALCVLSAGAGAGAGAAIPRVPTQASNIVPVFELEQQQVTDDQKAQAQANATGHPVYANGGVYLPAPKALP